MTKAFPLQVKKVRRAGRRPKAGDRYPGGSLKPPGPNPRVIELRRQIAADPRMAENPLDAAFANGWLTQDEHRAGRAYRAIWLRARTGAPGTGRLALPETAAEETANSALDFGGLADAEVAALWDQAFETHGPAAPEARETAAREAMQALRLIAARVRGPARAELFSVCVLEAWPQWLLGRLAGAQLKRRAEAQKRALAETELAVARRASSRGEERRELLVEALAGVAAVLRPPRPPRGPTPVPHRAALCPSLLEAADYVTTEGELLFRVERRGRRL